MKYPNRYSVDSNIYLVGHKVSFVHSLYFNIIRYTHWQKEPGTLYFNHQLMRKLIIYIHRYYKSPNGHTIKYLFFVRPKLTYLNSYGSGHLIFYGGWTLAWTFYVHFFFCIHPMSVTDCCYSKAISYFRPFLNTNILPYFILHAS